MPPITNEEDFKKKLKEILEKGANTLQDGSIRVKSTIEKLDLTRINIEFIDLDNKDNQKKLSTLFDINGHKDPNEIAEILKRGLREIEHTELANLFISHILDDIRPLSKLVIGEKLV